MRSSLCSCNSRDETGLLSQRVHTRHVCHCCCGGFSARGHQWSLTSPLKSPCRAWLLQCVTLRSSNAWASWGWRTAGISPRLKAEGSGLLTRPPPGREAPWLHPAPLLPLPAAPRSLLHWCPQSSALHGESGSPGYRPWIKAWLLQPEGVGQNPVLLLSSCAKPHPTLC